MPGYKIAYNNRVALVGKTGSGKSYLARELLAAEPRLIVCNPKGDPTMPRAWHLTDYREGYKRLLAGEPGRLHLGPQSSRQGWERYLWEIARLTNVKVYWDELLNVGPALNSEGLAMLYTQGRSQGIGVWAAFQRPSRVPPYALTEVEFTFTFKLRRFEDRKRMAEEIGLKAYPELVDHQFVMDGEKLPRPLLCQWNGKLDIIAAL